MNESKTDAPSARGDGKTQGPGRFASVCLHPFAAAHCVLLAALFSSGGLHAAEPSAPDLREEAARLNSRGIELYKKQQYGPAVEQLSAAYRLDPDPSIVCNLARAQYKLLPGSAAVTYLEKCLATDATLSEASRQTLEGYLKDARQRAASDEPEPAPAPLVVSPVPEPSPPQASRPLWRWALGGGLVTAGAGLLVGGSVAWSMHGQCASPDPPCERIYKTEPGGAAAVVLGSAALIGGVVLLALPAARPRPAAGK